MISGHQKVYNLSRRVNGARGGSRAAARLSSPKSSRRSITEPVTFPNLTASAKPVSWQRDTREDFGELSRAAARVVPPWRLTRAHGLEIF